MRIAVRYLGERRGRNYVESIEKAEEVLIGHAP